jgi:hypothetical protein
MKESDKLWKHSAKLQAALVAGIVIVCIWVTNLHDEQIVLRVLAICEAVVIAAIGGRVSMQVGQTIMDGIQQMKSASTDIQVLTERREGAAKAFQDDDGPLVP